MTALDINLNCESKKEHVPEIERFIRTVQEHDRSAQATMRFKQKSKLIMVHPVASAIFWLNAFPPSTPVALSSDTKSPEQLILGNKVNYKTFCRLQSGEYVQLHQEDEPRTQLLLTRLSA